MKLCVLTYADAVRRHPAEVAAIIAKLRASKSKSRRARATSLVWSYECLVEVCGGGSFEDLLNGRFQAQESTTRTWLQAEVGRWRGASSYITDVPELKTRVEEQERVATAERARLDAMTPEERQQEVDDLLRQLRGSGFVELTLVKP